VSQPPADGMETVTKPKPKGGIGIVLIVGLVLIGAALVAWRVLSAPADSYQYGTPPAGPNAKPDPPNPDKVKTLPGKDAS
jgi:hypothetical protein